MFDGSGFAVWYEALRGYDPVLLGAAALGATWLMLRLIHRQPGDGPARRDAAVVLAFALPYALVFGAFGRSFERFFLPLYPAVGLLAALGVRQGAALAGRAMPGLRPAFGPVLAVAALTLPTYAATRLVWLRAQPDTFTLAANALDVVDRSGRQSLLLHPRATLPVVGRLATDEEDRDQTSAWLQYLVDRARAGVAVDGRPLQSFPQALSKLVRQHPAPGDAGALLGALPALGCVLALDILPDRDAEPGSLEDALRSCADIVWQVPASDVGVFAENGYQEPDMLHVVLAAEVWGPRLALWKFR